MNFLFVHQNFPAQFRHVAAALANRPEHRVVAVGEAGNVQARAGHLKPIQLLGYRQEALGSPATHHYIRDFEGAIRRGQNITRIALQLRDQGFRPDVVVAHPGWGEALFLRDVFPQARQIYYFEFYYRGEGSDVGFDPEFPASLDDRLKVRVKNVTQLLCLEAADAGMSPTRWQRNQYPVEFASRIRVLHEGIGTRQARPDPAARFQVGDRTFVAGDEVVTYVARNLEPYRGFHIFMRALPAILAARPGAHVLVVGGDDVSYGRRLAEGGTYRALYREELGERVDWSRVHFLGKVPYGDFLRILQISAAHVYLTYPFVLSWSMLEAMSAGCALIASATAPVREVVRHGENGRLVDFFDVDALSAEVVNALANPDACREMRARARQTIVADFDLETRCLPSMLNYLLGEDHDAVGSNGDS